MIDKIHYLAIIILGRKCPACGHPRRSDPAGSVYWYCPMCGTISAKYKSWSDYAVKHGTMQMGKNVITYPGVRMGTGCYIGDNTVLGCMPRSGALSRHKASVPLDTVIGNNVTIGIGVIIYRGVKIEDNVFIGDIATIRENCTIGEGSIIGRLVSIEPRTVIGKRVRTAAVTHLTSDMVIEDNVFIGSHVSTTNDNSMGRGEENQRGAHIKRGARIGSNATLLPRITIGENAVVAAGAIVTRDMPDNSIVMGKKAEPKPEMVYIHDEDAQISGMMEVRR